MAVKGVRDAPTAVFDFWEGIGMKRMKLEAPWYTWQKKVKALFERDPDIDVGDIYPVSEGSDYAFDIRVKKHAKFLALNQAMPTFVRFGNVRLAVCLFDEENNSDGVALALEQMRAIFDGNPIVEDICEVEDDAGALHGYVRFRPEVVQFFDDDLRDYNGNWSGLAQDIAREVFGAGCIGVNFCTAPKERAERAQDS